jgi:hypothetical protein
MSKKVEATIPGIEKSRLWTIADCLSDAFLAVCDEGRLVGSIIMEVRYQNGDRILRIDGHGECELAVPEQEGASEALGEPKASEHTSPNAREAAMRDADWVRSEVSNTDHPAWVRQHFAMISTHIYDLIRSISTSSGE